MNIFDLRSQIQIAFLRIHILHQSTVLCFELPICDQASVTILLIEEKKAMLS